MIVLPPTFPYHFDNPLHLKEFYPPSLHQLSLQKKFPIKILNY
jgi:hypothetical protein